MGPWGCLHRHTTRRTQLVSPHGYRRQGGCRIISRCNGLRQRALKGFPHHQQLAARGVQQRRKFRVHTGPAAIGQQRSRLGLPVVHIGTQRVPHRLGIAPRLGGQHFNALRQQHRRFALHLHPVLQVFNHLDAVGQLHLEGGQWLLAQRRSCFRSITLPGQRVGNVEFAQVQQGLRLLRPLGGQHFLPLGALDVVELFAQRFGSALVFGVELPKDVLQLLGAGVGAQPVPDFGGTFPRGRRGERTTGQAVELLNVGVFGRSSRGHSRLGSKLMKVSNRLFSPVFTRVCPQRIALARNRLIQPANSSPDSARHGASICHRRRRVWPRPETAAPPATASMPGSLSPPRRAAPPARASRRRSR